VFADPLTEVGMRLVAPRPRSGPELAEHQLAALDSAADRYGPVLVGGISLGAHIATDWAAANPDRCAGLLLAMPGWLGGAGDAPGSVTARISAEAVDAHGVDGALGSATDGVPGWLADELTRAWRRAGAGLADALRVAQHRPAPTLAALARLTMPAGVVGCVDDPVHPFEVAVRWAGALPHSGLRSITFAEFGEDRAALGRAALAAHRVGVRSRVQDEVGDGHGDHHDGAEAAQQEG
jgi:pimeloyl-ACP methyl ester carboxylesterase